MSRSFAFLRVLALAAAGMVAVATVPANALPITYNFSGTFSDGATATGLISLNVYGIPTGPTSITTTSDLFSGFTYTVPGGNNNILDGSDVLVLSSPSYNRYLYLDFANPLTAGGADPLVLASSFECDNFGSTTYACTGNASQIRSFVSGSATPVPEPLTLSIFGAALLGVAGLVALGRKGTKPALTAV